MPVQGSRCAAGATVPPCAPARAGGRAVTASVASARERGPRGDEPRPGAGRWRAAARRRVPLRPVRGPLRTARRALGPGRPAACTGSAGTPTTSARRARRPAAASPTSRSRTTGCSGSPTRAGTSATGSSTRRRRRGPTERQLEFKEVDVDAPPPIVLGTGSEWVLPYAVGSTVKVLSYNGRRAVHLAGARAGDEPDRRTTAGGRVRARREVLRPLPARRGAPDLHVPAGRGAGVRARRPGARRAAAGRQDRSAQRRPRAAVPRSRPGRRCSTTPGTSSSTASAARSAGRFLFSGKDGALRTALFGAVETNGLSYALGPGSARSPG